MTTRASLRPHPLALVAWTVWGLWIATAVYDHDRTAPLAAAWLFVGLAIGCFSTVVMQGLEELVCSGTISFQFGRVHFAPAVPVLAGLIHGTFFGAIIAASMAAANWFNLSATRAALIGIPVGMAVITCVFLPWAFHRFGPKRIRPPKLRRCRGEGIRDWVR